MARRFPEWGNKACSVVAVVVGSWQEYLRSLIKRSLKILVRIFMSLG